MEEFKLTNRRTFVKNISLAGLAVPFINVNTKQINNKRKLTILHTNDMHSHIDPFPISDNEYPGLGGMTRIATLIDNVRNFEKNVLLLDAGDIFQGTPYFNRYKGELELKLMSRMGYAASTMGNHDFDNGIDGFGKVMHNAKFPFLCSNYDFKNTILENKTKSHEIIYIGKLKIGIIGIGIELKGLVNEINYKETKYLDPIEIANHWSKHLKLNEKCDLIICLSHLGFKYEINKISDVELAKKTKNIDVIIGGHTHTFLQKAITIKNLDNKKVIINQAGWGTLALGRIDIEFNKRLDNNDELSIEQKQIKNYAKI